MRLFLLTLISVFSLTAFGQNDTTKSLTDTLAPYQKSPFIPTFSLQTPDSSWFFNSSLNEKKPVLILYFSPDCGHCQLETENLLSKEDSLQNLQIVMVTSRPFEDMSHFAAHYKIYKFPNIKIGTDNAYHITRFYKIEFTPFSALYDKKGKLVKVYRKGIDMTELTKLVN